MATNNITDIGDPADWPQQVDQIREIDKLLRCLICFEYMDTAMIIPDCSHTYCSLCIRRYISYKNQCPTCTQVVSEPQLRNNRLVDHLIQQFAAIRSKLLGIVKTAAQNNDIQIESKSNPTSCKPEQIHPKSLNQTPIRPRKPAIVESDTSDDDLQMLETSVDEPSTPRVSTKNLNNANPFRTPEHRFTAPTASPKKCLLSPPFSNVSRQCQEPRVSTPERPKSSLSCSFTSPRNENSMFNASQICSPSQQTANVKKVPCPVCGVDVPERNINLHLDRCLTGDKKKESLRSSIPKRKPMPKIVYNLLKDKDLKKKLVEVGLPTTGDRQSMIKRHHEFTLQYNAQCDSLNPKSAPDIVKNMLSSTRKKENMSSAAANDRNVHKLEIEKGATTQVVEKAQKDYAHRHKSQFAQLIAEARNRAKKNSVNEKSIKNELTSEETPDTCIAGPSLEPECSVLDANPETSKLSENVIETENKTTVTVHKHIPFSETLQLPDTNCEDVSDSESVSMLSTTNIINKSAEYVSDYFSPLKEENNKTNYIATLKNRLRLSAARSSCASEVKAEKPSENVIHNSENSLQEVSSTTRTDIGKESESVSSHTHTNTKSPGRHRMVLMEDSNDAEFWDTLFKGQVDKNPPSEPCSVAQDTLDQGQGDFSGNMEEDWIESSTGQTSTCTGSSSVSLYSDQGEQVDVPSRPPSVASTVGYDTKADDIDGQKDHLCQVHTDNTVMNTPSLDCNTRKFDTAEENLFSPESPVLQAPGTRKRKRSFTQTDPEQVQTPSPSVPAQQAKTRKIQPLAVHNTNTENSPSTKKRGRPKKALLDPEICQEYLEDYIHDVVQPRVTRSRAKSNVT